MDYGKNLSEEQKALEAEREKQIQKLDGQIHESDRKYKVLTMEHEKVVKIIDTIKVRSPLFSYLTNFFFQQRGIPIIFKRIGCQLGDFQTDLNVNESNML